MAGVEDAYWKQTAILFKGGGEVDNSYKIFTINKLQKNFLRVFVPVKSVISWTKL